MRSVNWKATARHDNLIVNQRQMETHSELTILLDARCVAGLGPAGQTPLDRGCRLALDIFIHALGHRDEVRFAAYGDGVAALASTREGMVERLEELLSRLPAGGETSLGEAWDETRRLVRSTAGPVIVITSAEGDDSVEWAVQQMVGRGHPVTVISPRPGDASEPGHLTVERNRRRLSALERIRNVGAVVVDWGEGLVEVEAPGPSGVSL